MAPALQMGTAAGDDFYTKMKVAQGLKGDASACTYGAPPNVVDGAGHIGADHPLEDASHSSCVSQSVEADNPRAIPARVLLKGHPIGVDHPQEDASSCVAPPCARSTFGEDPYPHQLQLGDMGSGTLPSRSTGPTASHCERQGRSQDVSGITMARRHPNTWVKRLSEVEPMPRVKARGLT